ncbi:hypothetical protein [Desulfitobacterium hafniense]|uniref:Uncharacterized protein n=1 Tax=Desulfitobacterium hafniense TaxID=49338 RepID=A0A0W1JCF3_DESHA|nr:hypothetical protein [Desulfitobacterium hafniense]KTE89299.1 hypothetical protein AT727_12930 [Desulfitobacterium hafniense]
MEDRYLIYRELDGYVVKISNTIPEVIPDGCRVAIGDNLNFEEGHEIKFYIEIQGVAENGRITSAYMLQLPLVLRHLSQEKTTLKEDVEAVAETTAYNLEDTMAVAETLALSLMEIENLKAEIAALKGE